jgi:hypothetical protein
MLDTGRRGATKAREQFADQAGDFGYDLTDLQRVPRVPLLDRTGAQLP